jgi:hypothetical protein
MKGSADRPKESYVGDFAGRVGSELHGKLKTLTRDVFIEKPSDPQLIVEKIKEVLS